MPSMPTSTPIEIDSAVTTIILQHPVKEQIQAYENWLTEIVPVAQTAADHRGVNIIRPHEDSQPYSIILHFDSEANLRAWLESDTR